VEQPEVVQQELQAQRVALVRLVVQERLGLVPLELPVLQELGLPRRALPQVRQR